MIVLEATKLHFLFELYAKCLRRLWQLKANPGCVSEQGWGDLMRLVEIGKAKEASSPLTGLADDIERNEAPWKEYAALESPEAALMPSDLTAKLSLFEQLLVSLWCSTLCMYND